VLLAAEEDTILRRIRRRAPEIATSASYVEAHEFYGCCFAGSFAGYEPLARALQIPVRFGDVELVTEESLAAAHGQGLEMHVWTVNEEAEMERLLRLGVDGVMSDFPARLVAVAARLGVRSGRAHG
jgi:glycerophosphoryl diester phosphodiesterase